MKRRDDDYDDAWFAKLDAIVTGREMPSREDDDVLHVAAKLADALASLNDPDRVDVLDSQHTRVHSRLRQQTIVPLKSGKHSLLRTFLKLVAVLFVLFGVVGACPMNTQIATTTRNVGQQIWQAATSFEQINASSLALLTVKEARVRPLLPVTVPAGTQAVEFGIITDDTNPQTFRAFTADYRIAEQDVSIYEQAANLVVSSSAAQNIAIGTSEGRLFQDNAGNSILQWYQDGMTCQIASTLPVLELLALARQFHPITQWELIV